MPVLAGNIKTQKHIHTADDSVRPLWRRGVSCHVRFDDAEYVPNVRVVASGVRSDVRFCTGVCPSARNGRLREASLAAFQDVFGSISLQQ